MAEKSVDQLLVECERDWKKMFKERNKARVKSERYRLRLRATEAELTKLVKERV